MLEREAEEPLAFNMGRISILLELAQRLGELQDAEHMNVERFEATPNLVFKFAMSECMTRMTVIGELLDWAEGRLGHVSVRP